MNDEIKGIVAGVFLFAFCVFAAVQTAKAAYRAGQFRILNGMLDETGRMMAAARSLGDRSAEERMLRETKAVLDATERVKKALT